MASQPLEKIRTAPTVLTAPAPSAQVEWAAAAAALDRRTWGVVAKLRAVPARGESSIGSSWGEPARLPARQGAAFGSHPGTGRRSVPASSEPRPFDRGSFKLGH